MILISDTCENWSMPHTERRAILGVRVDILYTVYNLFNALSHSKSQVENDNVGNLVFKSVGSGTGMGGKGLGSHN